MSFKSKVIGILLIALGALPWLLKIQAVNDKIGTYAANPGEYLYQAVIIILGLLLLVKFKARAPVQVQAAK